MNPIQPLIGTPAIVWDSLRVEIDAIQGNKPLPIKGGWGYTQEDSCIIETQEPIGSFDGIAIEGEFAKRRIMEELIVQRQPGHGFCGIKWVKCRQALRRAEERYYDYVIYKVSAIPLVDWMSLKNEYEGPDGFGSPEFDMDAHQARREACAIRFESEFWFDITSFLGK